jgi:hypothetical protein
VVKPNSGPQYLKLLYCVSVGIKYRGLCFEKLQIEKIGDQANMHHSDSKFNSNAYNLTCEIFG